MIEQPTTPDAPAPAPAPTAQDTPRGGVAEGIFAEVERMTAGGAMSKSDAFEDISRRRDRRRQLLPHRPQARRCPGAPRAPRGRAAEAPGVEGGR
jgi:hypothetical protein